MGDRSGTESPVEFRYKTRKMNDGSKVVVEEGEVEQKKHKEKKHKKEKEKHKHKEKDKDKEKGKRKRSRSASESRKENGHKEKDDRGPRDDKASKSDAKDEKRDKDREREKDRDKDKEREKEKEKEREKERERDREREKEKEKEREREKERQRAKDAEREKERQERDRRRAEEDKERERKREKERAEREKDRASRSDRDRDRERDRDRRRDGDRKESERRKSPERRRDSKERRRSRSRENDRDAPAQPAAEKKETEEAYQARVMAQLEQIQAQETEEEKLARLRRERQEKYARLQAEAKAKEAVVTFAVPAPAPAPAPVAADLAPMDVEGPTPAVSVPASTTASPSRVGASVDVDDDEDGPMLRPKTEPSRAASPLVEDDPDLVVNIERNDLEKALKEKEEKGKGDMFDMFCDSMEELEKRKLVPKASGHHRTEDDPTLVDNWDDPEGYYQFRVGEVMDKRYEIMGFTGRGVFSTVLRAKDVKTEAPVAIKVLRANETMYKAGLKELEILQRIAKADPTGRHHCINFLSHFEYRGHLCLVFEPMAMNLRELLRKYGKNVGLSLDAVRLYGQHMLISLRHLEQCKILHADIKLDNILVNEKKNVAKIADFGSASTFEENAITPYLVSRFYRAPEIILGCEYDNSIDMWSVACTLYELYTGEILFKGKTNNEMLKQMMELKGRFPNKMLKRGQFRKKSFNDDFTFNQIENDPITQKEVVKVVNFTKALQTISDKLLSERGADPAGKAKLLQFIDLLEKMLNLDPSKRITVSAALRHPFIKNA